MIESLIVDSWLDTVLRQDAALSVVAPGGCWADVAPEGDGQPVASPWVVWFQVSGVDALAVGSGPRMVVDLVFEVRVTGRNMDYGALRAAANRVDARLEGQRMIAAVGGTISECHRIEPVRFTENAGGVIYRHLGGQYAIKVQSTAAGE